MNFDNIHIHLPECNSNQDHNHISLPTPGPAFLLIGLFVYFFICLFLIQLVLSLCVHQYGGHTQLYGEPISSHMPTEKDVFLPPSSESTDILSSDRSRDPEVPLTSIL